MDSLIVIITGILFCYEITWLLRLSEESSRFASLELIHESAWKFDTIIYNDLGMQTMPRGRRYAILCYRWVAQFQILNHKFRREWPGFDRNGRDIWILHEILHRYSAPGFCLAFPDHWERANSRLSFQKQFFTKFRHQNLLHGLFRTDFLHDYLTDFIIFFVNQ